MYTLDEIKATIKKALERHQSFDNVQFNTFCQLLIQLDSYSSENFNAFRQCVSSYSDLRQLINKAGTHGIQVEVVAFVAQMIALLQPNLGRFVMDDDWYIFRITSKYLSETQQISVMHLLSPLALVSSLDHYFDYSWTVISLKGKAVEEFNQRYAQALADAINTPEDCVACLSDLKKQCRSSGEDYGVYHPIIVQLMSILAPKFPRLLINLDSILAILERIPYDSQKLVIDASFDNLILWTDSERVGSWDRNLSMMATQYFSSLIARKIVSQNTLFSTLHFWKASQVIFDNIVAIIKPQLPQLLTDSKSALAFLEMLSSKRLEFFYPVAHLIRQAEEAGSALALMPDMERRTCLKRINIKVTNLADLQAWLAICHTFEEQTLIIRSLDKNNLPCSEAEIEALHSKPSEFPDILQRSIGKLKFYLGNSGGYSDISVRHRNAAVAMIKYLETTPDLTRKDVIPRFRAEYEKIQEEIWSFRIRGSHLLVQLGRVLDDFDDDGQECTSSLVEQTDCSL